MIKYLTKNRLIWKNQLCSENFKIYQILRSYKRFCESIENHNDTEDDFLNLSLEKFNYDNFFYKYYLNQYMKKNLILYNFLINNNILNQYQLDILSRTNDFINEDVNEFLDEVDFTKDDMFIHDHKQILKFYKYILYPMINEKIVNEEELINEFNNIEDSSEEFQNIFN
jgi:hypothetical protein